MRPIQLALCGTFDRLSYGDTAASLVVEAALRKRLADLTLVRYSAGARSASSWPYDVRPFEEFEHDLPGLTGVLIGNLEPLNLSSPSCSSPPAGGIHESAGSWLALALAASTAGLPVCWNSAAIRDIPEWARPLLTFALSLSRYVSARDENVVAAIRNAGFCGDSPIVPSVLFDIPQLIAARTVGAFLPEAIQKLLPAGNANGDYVVIQDHDLVQPMRATLEHALTQRGITSVLLSLLDVTTGAEPSARPSVPAPDPVNTATLIGHSAGVVALDESLVTTALAYGLPVLLPPVTRNLAGLFAADEVMTGTPGDPVPSAFLDRLGTYVLCARARNATSILDVHWNKLAAQFRQPSVPGQVGTAVSYLAWNRLLTATREQARLAASLQSSASPALTLETREQLSKELELAHANLAEADAKHQLEADLHQTWRTLAEQQRAETQTERQRLLDMKRSFDAAVHALTSENSALKDECARTLEMLRQREADFSAREDEIRYLQSSLSWRLTGPLRAAKDVWSARQR